ncbi:MAG TPA: c-type cytochrome domain-containing protein [Planctomycetota bacterium]|nr:c-type cytochrome domain-containing protein [Planctomycetota bacterium]
MRLATVTLIVLALTTPARAGEKAVSFEKDVVPIFKASCISCHKADKKKGKLDMSTYADLRKGGKQGDPVKPGDPAKSLLVEMISGKEPEMPEKGDKLTDAQVKVISDWIQQGAKP